MTTLSNVCELFLSHCRSAINLSPHTYRAYHFDLEDFSKFSGLNKIFAAIDKEALRNYIRYLREDRGFKETTIKRRVACLKLLFRWSKQENIIQENPFDSLNERIRLPKRLPRALAKDDGHLLRSATRIQHDQDSLSQHATKIAIQVMLATGIRVGELVALKRQDIDITNASLTIHGKGNRQRLVYLIDQRVQKDLSDYLNRREQFFAHEQAVFLDHKGRPVTTNQIRRQLKLFAQSAGIERHITPHMLRHTSATTWLEAGLDIRYVQKLLGHQSISTTEIYTQVTDEGLRGAMKRVLGGG